MRQTFDVIVIGVGSMGSAACYHLARRGVRVLGLEQFDIPHALGSGHGQSRMIRLAYYEHPDYVPLLRRSYELWDELGEELGRSIIHVTGGAFFGPPGSQVLEGSLRSVREHGLPHDLLDSVEAMRRFPQFVVPDDYQCLHDHHAGLVLPERAIAGHAELALRRGAELHGREAVTSWERDGDGVIVRTTKGEYAAAKVIFCGGAWTDRLVRDLGVPLVVTRQPMGWVWPKAPSQFELGQMPVWFIEHRDGSNHYGFPMLPGTPGLKLAMHVPGATTAADAADREMHPSDEADLRGLLRRHIPQADGPLLSMRICLYTNSPDGHFIIGPHPVHDNVILACGFSGHGFKFATVMGQALAELAIDGRSSLPIDFLNVKRFRPLQ